MSIHYIFLFEVFFFFYIIVLTAIVYSMCSMRISIFRLNILFCFLFFLNKQPFRHAAMNIHDILYSHNL